MTANLTISYLMKDTISFLSVFTAVALKAYFSINQVPRSSERKKNTNIQAHSFTEHVSIKCLLEAK